MRNNNVLLHVVLHLLTPAAPICFDLRLVLVESVTIGFKAMRTVQFGGHIFPFTFLIYVQYIGMIHMRQ